MIIGLSRTGGNFLAAVKSFDANIEIIDTFVLNVKNLNVYCSLPLEKAGPSVHTGQASRGITTDVTTQSGWEAPLRHYVAILAVGQAVLSQYDQVCDACNVCEWKMLILEPFLSFGHIWTQTIVG